MKDKKAFDVLVIGGGVAGMTCAYRLACGGKNVALVEREALGGTAYRDGALPVKGLLDIFKTHPTLTNNEVLTSWEKRFKKLEALNQKQIAHPNITLVIGEGSFTSPYTYEVENTIYEADWIVIATGTSPHSPFELQIDEKTILSHRSLINFPLEPSNIAILGGNVEGFELAFVYLKLGYKVTLIEKEKDLLAGNDRDLVKPLQQELKELGCMIKTGTMVENIKKENQGVAIKLQTGEEIKAAQAVLTLARKVNLPLGLDNARVKTQKGYVATNESFQTEQEHIYAIGDVNGVHGMAHVAWDQGRIVADSIVGKRVNTPQYQLIPRAVFTLPEMAGCGLQEVDCIQKGLRYTKGLASLSNTYRGWALNNCEEWVKVLIDEQGCLLGIWMVGKQVSEKVGFMTWFIQKAVKAQELIETLTINPSLDEGIKTALEEALKTKEELR